MITAIDDSIAAGTNPGRRENEPPKKQPDQQPPSEHDGDTSPNDDDLDAQDAAKKDDDDVKKEDVKVAEDGTDEEEEEKKEEDQDDELEDEDDKELEDGDEDDEYGDDDEYEYPLSDGEDKDADDDEEEKKARTAAALHDVQLESQSLKDILSAKGLDKVDSATAKELADATSTKEGVEEVEEPAPTMAETQAAFAEEVRQIKLQHQRQSGITEEEMAVLTSLLDVTASGTAVGAPAPPPPAPAARPPVCLLGALLSCMYFVSDTLGLISNRAHAVADIESSTCCG